MYIDFINPFILTYNNIQRVHIIWITMVLIQLDLGRSKSIIFMKFFFFGSLHRQTRTTFMRPLIRPK